MSPVRLGNSREGGGVFPGAVRAGCGAHVYHYDHMRGRTRAASCSCLACVICPCSALFAALAVCLHTPG
jgi:hypothetical protein